MTRLEIRWPDEMVEQVRVAKGRIKGAGAALRAMAFSERLGLIAQVVADWSAPDSAWRRELSAELGHESPFREGTVREGLDSALRAWNSGALVRCAEREFALDNPETAAALVPYSWTAVLAGGAVPMPTLLSGLLPLVLGSPVLMRESSHDRVTAALLKRSLEARHNKLGRAFEHLSLASDDPAFDELLEAPCVVATGSDETIRQIRGRLRPNQRFIAYGHRFSIGVIRVTADNDDESIHEIAQGFALDVSRWDQTGCLSPVIVYLVDTEIHHRRRIAEAISDALAELSLSMPRGELSNAVAASHASERAEARMRLSGEDAMLFEAPDHTVVLEANANPRPAPLHRFLRLMPVASITDLEDVLIPFATHLSTVAVAGAFAEDQSALHALLSRLGTSRITTPGKLQTPPIDWPHDGMPLFTPMARFMSRG